MGGDGEAVGAGGATCSAAGAGTGGAGTGGAGWERAGWAEASTCATLVFLLVNGGR